MRGVGLPGSCPCPSPPSLALKIINVLLPLNSSSLECFLCRRGQALRELEFCPQEVMQLEAAGTVDAFTDQPSMETRLPPSAGLSSAPPAGLGECKALKAGLRIKSETVSLHESRGR